MTNSRPTIFFDWNGTLIADTVHCWRATNHALKMFNLGPITYNHFRNCWAFPIADLYIAFGCDEDELHAREKELYKIWNAHYDRSVQKARLRQGARAALKALNGHSHDVLILSNYTVEKISAHTKRLGIHDYFSTILANDALRRNFKNRDKSDRLRAYMKNKNASKAIIVGDTPEEIEIAQHHGVVSIAITNGQCSAKRLRAARPDFLIHNLNEIPAIAHRVFGPTKRGKR